jgi:hypothetical protein
MSDDEDEVNKKKDLKKSLFYLCSSSHKLYKINHMMNPWMYETFEVF